MGEASPYCTNAFGKLVGNNASVTVESGWADGFPGDPKQLVGHALVYYTNIFARILPLQDMQTVSDIVAGINDSGNGSFLLLIAEIVVDIFEIIKGNEQHEACTAGYAGKLFDVTGNSAGQGFFELIGYYRFDSGSGKVQLCVAAPYTLFPVNLGCTYVPPPVELGEIPNFGAADDTRCVYFGSGRSDLKSLGLNISQSGSPDQGNPKSISNFLMSDMHITSTVVGCILDLLDKVFISAGDQGSTFFANIQKNLKSIVLAALVLYVCLVGIKIMTSGGSLRRGDYIMFAVKFALVSYFALGNAWFAIDDKGNKVGIYYGITDGAQQIASYFMEAQNMSDPLGHCRYQYGGDQVLSQRNIPATGSIKPTAGSTDAVKMTVWDMIDCRIISYLNMGTCNYSFAGLIAIWSITALIICSGIGFILCIAMFVYSYMLLKIIFKFVHIFILSMFVITILVLVSPIMITFALFDYTKGIFDSWFKMLLGYIIYPGLHFAFIALMLATFDNIYFGGLKMDPENPSIFQQCQTLGASNTPICAIANNIVQGVVLAGEIEVIAGIITNNPSAVSAGISTQGSGAAALNSSMKDMCDMNIGSIVKGLYETTDLWLLGSFTSMSSSVVEALFLTMLKLALMAFLFFMLMNSISTFFASLTGVESMDSMAKGDLSGGFKAAFSFGATAAFKAPFAIASALSKSGGKSDDKDKTTPRTPGPDK
jgi:type IV secretion system protein VirB6